MEKFKNKSVFIIIIVIVAVIVAFAPSLLQIADKFSPSSVYTQDNQYGGITYSGGQQVYGDTNLPEQFPEENIPRLSKRRLTFIA